ncbi:hypothetical protein HNY73_005077 [Argiope bruennichi]|uniref:Peptidase A9 domain-containing protein n=1 Tax=Argiope bruennichi TaxID=94029 RepID=A0A8T0FG24_ARGBR|nr:hypothetical protein HNY73_005077 [Argiope bruennichi]
MWSLAYAGCPLDIRESLAAQYFVDAIRDEDMQHSTRLMDAKDLKSALVYSMKYEATRTVSKTSKHVRPIEVEKDSEKKEDKFESLFNRTNLAHKLKQQFIYTAPNISLTTATGEKANIHGKLDASIECGSRRFQHKIYVADITDPCILGLDFLREFNFTVELERNEILTGGEEIPLFSANVEFLKLCSAFSKEKTVIPAGSECLVRGVTKFSEQFRYAVTNSPNQISEKDVLVAATLVDLKKETIPVRVLNVDNKPKTMDKGAVIASYEPVVDIVARPQEFSGKQPIQSILENIEGLNEDQRIALQKLFQEFQHLFSTCDADVGRCNVTQHKINTGDHPPIKQYPRRLPLARKKS